MHSSQRMGRAASACLLAVVASTFGCSDSSSPTRIKLDNAAPNATIVSQGSGLVAAYGFDEASGASVADASGNSNNGSFGGGVTRTTLGKFGSALVFAGSYVTVPAAASLNLTSGMTLEAWVYPTAAASNYATTIMKEQAGDYSYVLYNSAPGKPSAEIYANGERVTPGLSAVAVNRWSHLASTFDGTTVRLYVNGTQVASKAYAGPITTSNGALRIGGNAVWGEFFKGRIDEVRIYSRALSTGEIQSDMNTAVGVAGGTVPTPDTTVPTVNIASPTTSTVNTSPVALTGTAGDNVGVTQVTWTNSLGGSGTATGTTSWSATGVALHPGTNVITVTARDAANNAATTTVSVTLSAPAPTPTGLVAAYGFNEASGSSTTDASGNSNNGTFGSGVTRTTSGKFGSALVFAGNYVTVPHAASLNLTTAMTLEAWVYPTQSATNYATAVMKEQAGDYVYTLYNAAPGNPSAEINMSTSHTGERITPAPSSLPVNTWSHLASTFDGSSVRLYVNGAEVASKPYSGTIGTSTGALRIGGNAVWGEFFTGRMDEVRVYNRALSAGEVQSDMNTAVGGTSSTPPVQDVVPPTVSIASQAGFAAAATTASSVTLSGAASDNVAVTQVMWSNNRGGSGVASGTTSWSTSTIALQSGDNVLTVTAKDAANNVGTATVTMTYTPAPPAPPAAPTQLAVTTQPTTAQSASPLAPALVVQLRDASNKPVSQSGVVVTASMASGSASLSGTLTATTNASGAAGFSNLVLTGSGAQTLRFSATGLTAATSAPVTVSVSTGFATPNILNNASFETGWDGFTNGAGGAPTATRDNSLGYAGSWSMKTSWTPNGGGEGGTSTFYDFNSADRVWLRFYFRVTAPITSIMKFARFYSSPGRNTNFGGFFMGQGDNILGFGSDRENGAAVTYIGLHQNQVVDGNWHSIEMDYRRNGDPSGWPSVAFWFDGAPVSMPDGRDVIYAGQTHFYWQGGRLYLGERSSSEQLGSIEWLATLNAGNTTSGQVNIDKIAISTVGRIGP